MKTKLTLLVVLFAVAQYSLMAQGCSDAGFCTAGSLHSSAGEDEFKNSVQVYGIYGVGDGATSIFTPQVDVNIGVQKKGRVQLRLPYVFTSGSLGNTSGVGDFQVNYSHTIISKDSFALKGIIGARLASNKANIIQNGRALPMPYQTSLGTNDLLLGVALSYKMWNFTLGYQQPISQMNENGFIPNPLINKNDTDYFLSRNLRRKADIMFRVERRFDFNKFQLVLGLLPIYHLANDEATLNTFPQQTTVEVKNSAGLTLNFVVNGQYKINDKFTAHLLLGVPAVVRESRPDGLTRAFVLSPSIQWFF